MQAALGSIPSTEWGIHAFLLGLNLAVSTPASHSLIPPGRKTPLSVNTEGCQWPRLNWNQLGDKGVWIMEQAPGRPG